MLIICSSPRHFLLVFSVFFSNVIAASNQLPPSYELRDLKTNYTIQDGVGETIAYIPIKKPCLNVLFGGTHKEFCFIDSTTEDLSKTEGAGFYISLDTVSSKSVSFEYNTYWYSKRCRYYLDSEKPTCDQPYTN